MLSALKNSDVMTDVEADIKVYSVYGRVVDQRQKPVAGVSVLLWESNGALSMEGKSNASGEFKFDHKPCGDLCLEVDPEHHLKLACALLQNLPGEETRKIIVELKQGYLVTGRVVHNGKGLKNLIIRVKPVGAPDKRAKVHGGGASETGRGGAFDLVLTGGDKKLVIINDKYSDCSKRLEKEISVSDDTHLGKIEMP